MVDIVINVNINLALSNDISYWPVQFRTLHAALDGLEDLTAVDAVAEAQHIAAEIGSVR